MGSRNPSSTDRARGANRARDSRRRNPPRPSPLRLGRHLARADRRRAPVARTGRAPRRTARGCVMEPLSQRGAVDHPVCASPPTVCAKVSPSASAVAPIPKDGSDPVAIHAELTCEVRRLQSNLIRFGRALQGISKNLGPGKDFSKLVTSTFGLFGFQLAYAVGQVMDPAVLLDDGRQYLAQTELSLQQLFREICLDGRDYVCIAKVAPVAHHRDEAVDAGDQ